MSGEAVNIKGTRNGLVIQLDPETNIEEIKKSLIHKMESSGGFFNGARFTLLTAHKSINEKQFEDLVAICRHYGLEPVLDIHSSPAAHQDGSALKSRTAAKKTRSQVIPLMKQPAGDGEVAIMVARTLRNGQRIFSSLSVVIMGDVNPGAEVISESSIYIMGNCLGTIHAGSSGNTMAEVMAMKMKPTILRIGSFTSDPLNSATLQGPVSARIIKGSVVFSKYTV